MEQIINWWKEQLSGLEVDSCPAIDLPDNEQGGNFAVKIFQNGDQQRILKSMREIFTSAKGFKPEACRSESFETYLIGINKK